ncbi:TIGR04282 family arsenosugar biosynthesis glycosyltransferase [Sabulicella glaciei]|uniref:Glycosyltransferase n=1 Tax=Sabulicella glaciei TaxID=2984948 RepID=A0ABT3NR95_9PROT|nr:TIGR04282 family arsenosugar biosynthesis glycosyltransferase [Roseococcus sp. MDT2-1-1]MCW8084688.1 glycosyltransferase [Roseococcus sp. MDT2-1-1]
MCKDPARGKTRLAATMGAERAAIFAGAFLQDSAALAAEIAERLSVGAIAFAEGEVALPGFSVMPQAAGDLGRRMEAAFETLGYPSLLLGTDAPTLPPSLAELAMAGLRGGADAALVPALDGGYCLLALSRPLPALLRDMPWSTPGLMEATRRAAAGLRLVELPAWHDVDSEEDLALLRLSVEGQSPSGCAALPPWRATECRRILHDSRL